MYGLTPYHAQMVARNVDYNWNGVIENRELSFRNNSRRIADYNRDGRVTTAELAWSLQRGDIYITSDRKAYPAYYQNPGYGQPGFGHPGYAPYPRPGYGHPMPPHTPPYPTAPGYPYGRSNGNAFGQVLATTAVGAGVGAGVGYAVGGSNGAGTGAVIGGALGLISNLFD
jgi:hypothetical protein